MLAGVLLLQGCRGASGARLSAIPADGTILAFGASLTEGVGATDAESYPAVLAELSDRQVINAGVSGETTAEGLVRLPQVLAATQPDLVIFTSGGNDILRRQSLDNARENLAEMIELAQEQGAEVVLVGIPQWGPSVQAAPFYRDLAEEYNLVLEGDLIGTLLRQDAYKSDPIHFNAQGYRIMAEEIHELLDQSGAL